MEYFEKWKEKNKYSKSYAHFDNRRNLENVEKLIYNRNFVAKHGFYPFIYQRKFFNKFKSGKLIKKYKFRDLYYAAHIDRYIYSYYGYLINREYNIFTEKYDIDDVAVAYRNNSGKCNIDFAKQAFEFIKNNQNKTLNIFIGDFSNFFDMLEHKYLKNNLLRILRTRKMPDDFYNVFKNITKFSYFKLEKLLNLNHLGNSEIDLASLNSMQKVLTLKQFKENKHIIEKNKYNCGIPQGSPISAVLSNVYMIDFDIKMKKYIKSLNGLYIRYSDDFIIILQEQEEDINGIYKNIFQIIYSIPLLRLQREKTKTFKIKNSIITPTYIPDISDFSNKKNKIEFLGFEYDGKSIYLRERSITKYYSRLYAKINTILKYKGITKTGKRISCKELYKKYSIKGTKNIFVDNKYSSNFFTYVNNSNKIFYVFKKNNKIRLKTKRHLIKIRRKLDLLSETQEIDNKIYKEIIYKIWEI